MVKDLTSNFLALITMVYAMIELNIQATYGKLQKIGAGVQDTWLITGDFNNSLTIDDRVGQPITKAELQEFKDMVDNLQLTPLKSKECFYT